MQNKLSFCFLRHNLSAFVETETYRNRKFDPETEISASGSTFGFVSAQPLDMAQNNPYSLHALCEFDQSEQRFSTEGGSNKWLIAKGC